MLLNIRTLAQRRAISLSLCHLLVLHLCLQTITIPHVNADLDFWTKLKLIGLLALTNKISVVPIPMPIPVPIHLEGKEEVIYVRAPPPPISSAYSYMSSPMLEYGPSYSAGRGGGAGHYGGSKGHGDVVGYASELYPMVAAASVRYGDRIAPGSWHASHNAPTSSAAPTPAPGSRSPQRGRVNNRNRNPFGRSKEEYTPTTTTTTTPAPAQLDNDYYRTPYEPEVSKPQVETMKIAIIPVKESELVDIADQAQSQPPKESQDTSILPENLLNYIRQVQGLTLGGGESTESAQAKKAATTDTADGTSAAVSDSGDKVKASENSTATSTPTEPAAPALPPAPPTPIQYQPFQSYFSSQQPFKPITIQSAPAPTPIQSQWQQSLHSSGGVISTNQYRPPELKVIRTRYNPKAHLEQSTPIVRPLSSLGQVSSGQSSYSPNAAVAAGPPQQTQFIYSVSHQAYNAPLNTPYYSPSSYYSGSDNFGLTSFKQSQLKQSQDSSQSKPSYLSTPLTASASVESETWVKPNENGKSKFFNVGHRFTQLF